MTKVIYLAGPLRDCNESECKNWRDYCKIQLNDKFKLLDPMRNNYREGEVSARAEIVMCDLKDCSDADIILANAWKVSVGTSCEIMFGWQEHKIVIVVGKEENLSPWNIYFATKVLPDIETACKYIKDKLT